MQQKKISRRNRFEKQIQEGIMKKYRGLISALLCFMMVFNPIFIEVAVWAEDSASQPATNEAAQDAERAAAQADSAVVQTNQAESRLNAQGTIRTKWYMSSSTKRQINQANQDISRPRLMSVLRRAMYVPAPRMLQEK